MVGLFVVGGSVTDSDGAGGFTVNTNVTINVIVITVNIMGSKNPYFIYY
jgi:hypothetical protein